MQRCVRQPPPEDVATRVYVGIQLRVRAALRVGELRFASGLVEKMYAAVMNQPIRATGKCQVTVRPPKRMNGLDSFSFEDVIKLLGFEGIANTFSWSPGLRSWYSRSKIRTVTALREDSRNPFA